MSDRAFGAIVLLGLLAVLTAIFILIVTLAVHASEAIGPWAGIAFIISISVVCMLAFLILVIESRLPDDENDEVDRR